jgi:hypothetical protein
MLVQHGRLLGVLGRPRQTLDLFFCPALVEIDDPYDCHPLAETLQPEMDEFVWGDPTAPPDALWVRSRLPVVFGYRPLQIADARTYLLDAGFVAVLDAGGADPIAVPFACADNYCSECHLVMSRAEDAGVRSRIARYFWEMLEWAGGEGHDFRAEGLEWTYSWYPDDCDDGEELFTEVGRWRGLYYSDTTAWDGCLDPNYERPDWASGQWRCRWSRPRRLIRRCT